MYILPTAGGTMMTAALGLLIKRRYSFEIRTPVYSIKVFASDKALDDRPQRASLDGPSLRAEDVTDVLAEFVADPFLLVEGSRYYLFFEVYNVLSEKGEIGVAVSEDGVRWTYDRIVLREPFHLSYPQVFREGSNYYMIPEMLAAGKVRLYKARNFPYDWEPAGELLDGRYVDSSTFFYRGKWWMFSGSDDGLHLFYSAALNGGWREHPASPVVRDSMNNSRPAGRVVVLEDAIYRFAQEGEEYYGRSVFRFRITELSETEYREEAGERILGGGREGSCWYEDGMHHLEQQPLPSGGWLVAVDGHVFRNTSYIPWRIRRTFHRMTFKRKLRE
ncbi:glucosamine inositolphosphorylceramide transferase family protein [Gorillibacterium sp. sgz500922]|uniref:glucosamine inositolphosphorylceramide transferase family protein n=1 Tax=Gorillibacterium sp. sgz500922 TaxID=3446694 RepID=UPI003F67183E